MQSVAEKLMTNFRPTFTQKKKKEKSETMWSLCYWNQNQRRTIYKLHIKVGKILAMQSSAHENNIKLTESSTSYSQRPLNLCFTKETQLPVILGN